MSEAIPKFPFKLLQCLSCNMSCTGTNTIVENGSFHQDCFIKVMQHCATTVWLYCSLVQQFQTRKLYTSKNVINTFSQTTKFLNFSSWGIWCVSVVWKWWMSILSLMPDQATLDTMIFPESDAPPRQNPAHIVCITTNSWSSFNRNVLCIHHTAQTLSLPTSIILEQGESRGALLGSNTEPWFLHHGTQIRDVLLGQKYQLLWYDMWRNKGSVSFLLLLNIHNRAIYRRCVT